MRHDLARAQFEQLRGHREPQLCGRSGVPTPDARITSDPSAAATHARSDSSSKTLPSSSMDSTTSAIAPTGAGTTRLQFGQQGSLGGDRGAGVGIVQLRQ